MSQLELWNITKTSALYSTAAEHFLFFIWICISLSRLRGLVTEVYFSSPPTQFQAESKLLVWADLFSVDGVWMQPWLLYINNTVVCKRRTIKQQGSSEINLCVDLSWTETDTSHFNIFEECHPWLILDTLDSCDHERPWCDGLIAWWKNRARGLRGLEKTESDGEGLSDTQGGRTAEIAGLRLSPLSQLFLNSPCLVKQDDRGEEKKKGCTGVNRKLPHHRRRAGDTLKVST